MEGLSCDRDGGGSYFAGSLLEWWKEGIAIGIGRLIGGACGGGGLRFIRGCSVCV